MKNKKYLFYSLFAYIIYILSFYIYLVAFCEYVSIELLQDYQNCNNDFEYLWNNEIIPSFIYVFGAFILSGLYTLIEKKESLYRIFFLFINVLIVLHALNHFV